MNLYQFHDHPESIHSHDKADTHVVDVFWNKYKNNPKELKTRKHAITKSSKYSFYYASDILKGRFPLGEPAIATDPYQAKDYATTILKGRFKLAEPTIAKNSYASYIYALKVLKGPFKLGEPAILKDPEDALLYAKNVLKKPWPKAEPIIASNIWTTIEYNTSFNQHLAYTRTYKI
jgi:hypothetical protein